VAAVGWATLTWPRQIDGDDVLAGLRQLAGSRLAPVVLRADARNGRVEHRVGCGSPAAADILVRPVPGLGSTEAGSTAVDDLNAAVSIRFSTRRRTITLADPERVTAGVLHALARVRGSEHLVLEWVLTTPLSPEAVPTRVEGLGSERLATAALQAPFRAPAPLDGERRRALSVKRAEPGWRVLGRLGVRAATGARRQQLLGGVLSALRATESPGLRVVVRSARTGTFGKPGILGHGPAALSVPEVAMLAAWPVGPTEALPIQRVVSKRLPAHRSLPLASSEPASRSVGVSNYPGPERALVLGTTDGLRHLHLLGPTGVGKSTLLLGLISADMRAGRSCVVVDPKGDLVADVLARVPAARRDDVVVLDPSRKQLVGLNPLAGVHDPDLVADGLLNVLHQLFESSWGPRTQDIVHAGLLTLARAGGQSLVSLPVLLTNESFRRRLTADLDDPLGVEGFWAWYESISVEQRLTAMGPVMNKLRTILMRPGLRAMIGQSHPRFDLSEVFERPRIVLVNLSRGQLGPEGAALFGALVMHQLWQGAQARSATPAEQRRPVMAYLDEFQDYLRLPLDLTEILTQARGLGLGLTLAHQHLGQLPTAVRDAVLGNAGSRVIFRLNQSDAAFVARGGRGLDVEDITGLGAYEIYADLLQGAVPTGWMSGRTKPPPDARADTSAMRRHSLDRWGTSRDTTEAELRALVTTDRPGTGGGQAPKIGPRRRRQTGEAS
jgi:hypothetical protein